VLEDGDLLLELDAGDLLLELFDEAGDCDLELFGGAEDLGFLFFFDDTDGLDM